jgi:serine/threonine-protein kinase RsbW
MPQIAAPATVELRLPSTAPSVALVRAALKGLSGSLDLDPGLVDDIQMVASEACNNVVLHAYDEHGPGPLNVVAVATRGGIDVVVRDEGCGLEPGLAGCEDRRGLGLAVIESLTDQMHALPRPGGGTEVRMSFERRIPGLATHAGEHSDPGPRAMTLPLPGDILASVEPVSLMGGVFGRMTRTLAAHARFSIDRFSELHVVIDSLARNAERWARDGRMSFALGADQRRLMMRIGPLRERAGSALAEGAVARSLPLLVDEIKLEPVRGAAVLYLALAERGYAQTA